MNISGVVLSKRHFELFKKECEYNLKRLGLLSWKVFYELADLEGESCFARCQWKYSGRVATIQLAKYFPKPFDNLEKQIKESALHECLELLLSCISDIASTREFDRLELDKEVHSVIRTLEKIL